MPYRMATTRLTVDGTRYRVPGRYTLDQLLEHESTPVRMWVEGRNNWALATENETLLGYSGRAEIYRSQRRYNRFELIAFAICYLWVILIQVDSFRKGKGFFSRNKE